jgi:hypothetical protein
VRGQVDRLCARYRRDDAVFAQGAGAREQGISGSVQSRGQLCAQGIIVHLRHSINDLAIPEDDEVGGILVDESPSLSAECAARAEGLDDTPRAAEHLRCRRVDQIGLRRRVVSSAIWAFRSARPCASLGRSRVRSLTLFCTVAIILLFCES